MDVRGTGEMLDIAMHVTQGGKGYALPKGVVLGCPQPVRHVSQLLPGDLLLHTGHVVIFSGTARIGAVGGGSRGLRVFESTSRCGGVCESVYDPSTFDGWWILRLRMGDGDDRDCPDWLDAAAAILAEAKAP